MLPAGRDLRFVTGTQEGVDTLRPFYDGDYVHQRMSAVRESITHIRTNWSQYTKFMDLLRNLIQDKLVSNPDRVFLERARDLLAVERQKEWKSKAGDVTNDDFSAIRVYTSEVGYNAFFSLIYAIFRRDNSVNSEDTIRAAVFLIELINIDLFNYCLKNPKYSNFQGEVYRGISLAAEDFQKFQDLLKKPIPQRYISVPLSLMSSTLDYNVAKRWLQSLTDCKWPLIMKIHVIELKPSYLQFYRKKFPTCVVSGICAVNIQKISDFPDEKEVLLRGAFFQVLRLHAKREINGRTLHILEVVMLNSNRDHLTSVSLGDQEAEARQLFGLMVSVTRFEFCVKYCKKHCLHDDRKEYEKLLTENREKLQQLMSK